MRWYEWFECPCFFGYLVCIHWEAKKYFDLPEGAMNQLHRRPFYDDARLSDVEMPAHVVLFSLNIYLIKVLYVEIINSDCPPCWSLGLNSNKSIEKGHPSYADNDLPDVRNLFRSFCLIFLCLRQSPSRLWWYPIFVLFFQRISAKYCAWTVVSGAVESECSCKTGCKGWRSIGLLEASLHCWGYSEYLALRLNSGEKRLG